MESIGGVKGKKGDVDGAQLFFAYDQGCCYNFNSHNLFAIVSSCRLFVVYKEYVYIWTGTNYNCAL